MTLTRRSPNRDVESLVPSSQFRGVYQCSTTTDVTRPFPVPGRDTYRDVTLPFVKGLRGTSETGM